MKKVICSLVIENAALQKYFIEPWAYCWELALCMLEIIV